MISFPHQNTLFWYNKNVEENFAWKVVYLAVIFSLIVLGIAYYIISPRDSSYFNAKKTEKIAEFKNLRLEGRKEGKKTWEFFAESGWTAKNQEITHLYRVRRGKIYQNGELTVNHFIAPEVKIYHPGDNLEASGTCEAYFDLEKFSLHPKRAKKWTKISADSIKYFPAEKISRISSRVTLFQKDNTIRAEEITIYHEKRTAYLNGNIRLERSNGVIKTNSISYAGETGQLDAIGKVAMLLRGGKIKTEIKCDRAALFTDADKDINLSGSVEAAQGKKISIAREGTYSVKKRGLFLRGGTSSVIEKARAVIKEGTAAKLRGPQTKDFLKEKTVVTAEEMFFSTRTGDARASGRVKVTQKGKEARAEAAVYDDMTETITLTGNVFMKKGSEWLKAGKVLVSVKDETFEAVGLVEAKFKL